MVMSQHICYRSSFYMHGFAGDESDLMLVRFKVLLICTHFLAQILTVIASGRNALGQWESLGRSGKPGVGTGGGHPLFVYPSAAPVPRCLLWRDDCNRYSIDEVK